MIDQQIHIMARRDTLRLMRIKTAKTPQDKHRKMDCCQETHLNATMFLQSSFLNGLKFGFRILRIIKES